MFLTPLPGFSIPSYGEQLEGDKELKKYDGFSKKVSICPVEFDSRGIVEFELGGYNLGTIQRRRKKIKTLDGGVMYQDFGFNEQDRSISFTVNNPTVEINQRLEEWARDGAELQVVCFYQVFVVTAIKAIPNATRTTFHMDVVDVF